MKYEILLWNTFIFVCQFYYICFSLTKQKCVHREKMSSDSENLMALILISNICFSKSKNKIKKKKKSKTPKSIWTKPWLKNRNHKSAYNNITSEVLLTDKEEFWRCLRMNTTSYEVSNITKFPATYMIFMLLVCFKQILCGYLI